MNTPEITYMYDINFNKLHHHRHQHRSTNCQLDRKTASLVGEMKVWRIEALAKEAQADLMRPLSACKKKEVSRVLLIPLCIKTGLMASFAELLIDKHEIIITSQHEAIFSFVSAKDA